jgi:hypothetical protein
MMTKQMTSRDDQPGPHRGRVRPYAMTGGRTRPTHDDLEIEALVSTTAMVEQTPKLTVEQRAMAALGRVDVRTVASATPPLIAFGWSGWAVTAQG